MIKGAQKQMIVVRTGNSRYFDEAYFVLRREITAEKESEGEMISEASRILRESTVDTREPRKKKGRGLLLFFGGILLGVIVTLALCLLLL